MIIEIAKVSADGNNIKIEGCALSGLGARSIPVLVGRRKSVSFQIFKIQLS